MKISVTHQGNVALVTVAGRLSSDKADFFQEQLLAAIERHPKAMVVDFRDLTFITSSGLRALIVAAKRCSVDGYHIHLCGMVDAVREVFAISGLMRIFPVHRSVAEGLAAAGV